jgi:hypothetical protein
MSERLPVHASRSSGAGSTVMPNVAAEWLLTAGERGNLATASTPHTRAAWRGRSATSFVSMSMGPPTSRGCTNCFPPSVPAHAQLARRGVAIRGLLWRSHPALIRFDQDANRVLGTLVNRAGGQLVRHGSDRDFLVASRPTCSGVANRISGERSTPAA